MSLSIFDTLTNYFEDSSLFVGANNIELLVNTYQDISDADNVKINVIIPSDPIIEVVWEGSIIDSQYIQYYIQSTDIPVSGLYKLYAEVNWADGTKLYGETAILKILNPGE